MPHGAHVPRAGAGGGAAHQPHNTAEMAGEPGEGGKESGWRGEKRVGG